MVKFSEEIKKKRNYYDVLGVSQEAKFEELETNYELMKKNLLVEKNNLKREKKKLILEGGFKLEKEKLLRAEERVKRAYSILKDPAWRKVYDGFFERGMEGFFEEKAEGDWSLFFLNVDLIHSNSELEKAWSLLEGNKAKDKKSFIESTKEDCSNDKNSSREVTFFLGEEQEKKFFWPYTRLPFILVIYFLGAIIIGFWFVNKNKEK